MAVSHERAHAGFLGQSEGLLVVGFGLRDIGRVGVSMDGAKLVQRERLVPAFLLLSGQVERLAACCRASSPSRQTTDLAEAIRPSGNGYPSAPVRIFRGSPPPERAPLYEAPLERRGKAQIRRNQLQPVQVARGPTEARPCSNTRMASSRSP